MKITPREAGRKNKLRMSQIVEMLRLYEEVDEYGERKYRVWQLLEKYKISEPTFFRYKRMMEKKLLNPTSNSGRVD